MDQEESPIFWLGGVKSSWTDIQVNCRFVDQFFLCKRLI